MKNLILRLSMIVFLVAAIAACTPTATSRAAGEVVDDATLTAKVKTELARTTGLGETLAINVDTYRGVVSLGGFVNDERQRRLAGDAARRVTGVREVHNNLEIKPAK